MCNDVGTGLRTHPLAITMECEWGSLNNEFEPSSRAERSRTVLEMFSINSLTNVAQEQCKYRTNLN